MCNQRYKRGYSSSRDKGGLRFDVQAVVEYIREGKHEFYTTTPDGQQTVQVHAIKKEGAVPYLTTSPDGRLPNNLDFLPVCNY